MKTFKVCLFMTTIFFNFYSCSNKESEITLESDIINDIFLQLVTNDEIFPLFPPPPPPMSLDKSGLVNTDNIKYNKYKDLISKIDSSRYVFSIEDSTALLFDSSLIIETLKDEGLYKYFENSFYINNNSNKNEIPIKIERIKNVGKYELIKRSSLVQKRINFTTGRFLEFKYYYFGNLIFSKVFLDKSHELGFIVFIRNCGFECDRKYIVIIERKNNKWIINKRISIWDTLVNTL